MKKYILLIFVLSIFGTKAFADFAVKNADGVMIYYKTINDGTELEVIKNASVGCYSGSVNIPDSVTYMNKTYSVTSIGRNAFSNSSDLSAVTIPNSVTSIGEWAFNGCSGLTTFTISNNVTSIGDGAFSGCSGLTTVTIPNSVTSIGGWTFNGCSGLTSITIPNSVTSIGEYAFWECSGLTSITIPNSVTSIGYMAFADCRVLTSITIPNSVKSIGGGAFGYCSGLTSINVENGNSTYDSRGNCNAIIETNTNTLITGCKTTIIPNNVTSVGDFAFYGCTDMSIITIPNSVTSIGKDAFWGCCGLTSVTIPNNVTKIGDSAFNGCDLPEVISKIENPFYLDASTFSNNTYNNATLYVPVGTIEKYKATEGWKKFASIEEGPTSDINSIDIDSSNKIKRYGIDGRIVTNSRKGINIIQMNNGKTRKVVVK
jgi:hypothetical protein